MSPEQFNALLAVLNGIDMGIAIIAFVIPMSALGIIIARGPR